MANSMVEGRKANEKRLILIEAVRDALEEIMEELLLSVEKKEELKRK